MISQLLEAIKPSKSESRLEARLAEAITDRDTKRATLDGMLAADQDGAAVMKAEDALAASERRVLNLQSALNAARGKAAAEQVESAQEAKRGAWNKTVVLAEDRHKEIERLQQAMVTFAASYNEVLKINSELLAHLPMGHDSIAAMTDRFALETMLRKQLVKLGLAWCFTWPYGAATLPDMLPQSESALGVIRRSVPKDLQ